MPEGLTQLSVSGSYIRYPRLLRGDESLPNDRVLESALVTISGRHHFGEGWSADLSVPAGLASLSGGGLAREGVSGFGDIELGGRYELGALWGVGGYNPSLTLRVGLGLPTGAVAERGAAMDMPMALRVGMATFGAVAELRYTQFLDRYVAMAAFAEVRTPLSGDADGRVPGARFRGGIEGLVFPIDWLILRVGLEYQHIGRFDEGSGVLATNSGGNWLRLEGLALFRLGDVLSLGAGARGPLYINANGQQLAEEWGVQAVAAVVFGASDEHDHDHDDGEHAHGEHGHGDHAHEGHDHGGHGDHGHGAHDGGHQHHDAAPLTEGDVSDVAQGGESFAIEEALAPGRLTVIDFWAEWCHPCGHIDVMLRELAATHPELAVRRAEVTTPSSAVVQAHLSDDATLPQIWIYDAEGQRIDRLIGVDEEAARARLEQLLAGRAPAPEATPVEEAEPTPAEPEPAVEPDPNVTTAD